MLNLDVAGLWQWTHEAEPSLMLTHLHGEVKVTPPDDMKAAEFFPWFQEALAARRVVGFSSLDKLPEEADRVSLHHRHNHPPDGTRWRHHFSAVQQVLLNLIVNAMDALAESDTPDGTVRVLARVIEPATVEVRVCDKGPGIPEEKIGRLFEPFFTTKATGMGMGPAGFPNHHRSPQGKTHRRKPPRRRCRLLFHAANHGYHPSLAMTPPSAPGSAPETDPPVIHVVDDDVSHLRSLSRMLCASDFDVRIHDSATEFLANLPADEHGCVITDLMMPEMDGIALQQALRDATNPLPIVFLTGHGDVPVTVRAMKNGAEDFPTKNAPKEDLIAAVNRALERNKLDRLKSEAWVGHGSHHITDTAATK